MLVLLLACSSPQDSDPVADGPHGCSGAMLRAVWEGPIDGDALEAALEAAVPGMSCWANEPAGFVECTPAVDSCSWGPEEAATHEDAFLAALAGFDARFEAYAYAVVEECACRVY
ncbi:MAG: hypothetical protein H6737_04095 [Alphaproteobacteria bacterium]|nr:hypothetical protein [Alphaproteobacteria bacterium]